MLQIKLLIVDDDRFLRQLLADVLGREYEILQAGNGDEGLRLALSERPDAVLVDLTMPVSGLTTIRGMYEDASTREIPVVVMTSRCLDEGPQGFLANEANVRDCFNKGDSLQPLKVKLSMILPSLTPFI